MRSLLVLSLVACPCAMGASPFNFGAGSGASRATVDALASFRSAGFGMFMHNGPITQWGTDIGWPLVCASLPCSVPGPGNVARNITTTEELGAHRRAYADLAASWDPSDWNATAVADSAAAAGFKYVVYTTVHCDGFANWPSAVTTYNVMASKFGRDIFGELAAALRARGLKVGAYVCTTQWGPDDADYVWPDPMTTLNVNGGEFPTYDVGAHGDRWNRYVAKLHGLVDELIEGYAPDLLWFDCHNAPPWDTRLDEVAARARAANPGALVLARNGVFSDYLELPDQSEAQVSSGVLAFQDGASAPFEVGSTLQLSKQWAFDPKSAQKPASQVLANLIMIRARGGNYLLNVAPGPTGAFAPAADGVLDDLAAWMRVNEEALVGAAPVYPYNLGTAAYFTAKEGPEGALFYYVLLPTVVPASDPAKAVALPANVTLPALRPTLLGKTLARAEVLGTDAPAEATAGKDGLVLRVPDARPASAKDGLVFKLTFA